jgi:xanthine dehydrogenase accessory factor
MASWLEQLAGAGRGVGVRVTVIQAEGSTPRGIGTGMTVWAGGFSGTIGGGTLEHQAMAHARAMLARPAGPLWTRERRDFPLGPALGQCCGGFVRLAFESVGPEAAAALPAAPASARAVLARALDGGTPPVVIADRQAAGDLPLAVAKVVRELISGIRPAGGALVRLRGGPDWFVEPLALPGTPLLLYGAGHVGRALVKVLEGLPFELTWVDVAPSRFPDPVPAHAAVAVAADPARIAAAARPEAYHLVMTFSHALDLDVCHAVLARGAFAYLGLIGSATKKARFLKRLAELGIAESRLARLTCPIGIAGVGGKEPAAIAVATAADLLRRRDLGAAAVPGSVPAIAEGSGR